MVGIGFYWGALTFYVDASQALFLPRRTRMLQASAGILTDLVVCGDRVDHRHERGRRHLGGRAA